MNTNQIARIAGLVGEPARAAMLMELMDSRSLTAQELARAGNVTAQTASRHLAQLVEAGLLCVEQRGRHRYHRLASVEVARVLEGIMQLAVKGTATPRRTVVTGPRDESMRMARTCYDHLAGRLGVAIAERLIDDGAVEFEDDAGRVTSAAGAVLTRWGIDPAVAPAASKRPGRPQCRPCLDWSERRPHLAGQLGTRLCSHCLDQGWLVRRSGTRSLAVTPKGTLALRGILGHEAWRKVVGGERA
jgi:DNA-binding transcriptional ArsR family regulator